MERIQPEALRLTCPLFADELERCEPLEGLEPPAKVVGADEVGEMLFELQVAVVVKALDSGFFDRAVHPLDQAVRTRMLDLGEMVFDAFLAAAHIEHMGHVAGSWAIGIARRKAELNAFVGENSVDFIGDGSDQGDEEGRCRSPTGLLDQLYKGELACAINGDMEI